MQFDFGQNWDDFSKNALTPEKIEQATLHFNELFEGIEISGKSFLDVGFGQGLSLLIATQMGAKTVGCDINPLCSRVLENNRKFFQEQANQLIPVIVGSILERTTKKEIIDYCPNQKVKKFDIVHSWGVLHHTDHMWEAIDQCISLVSKNGYFIISIYNKHWSSKMWGIIKRFYNIAPKFVKWFMIKFFYAIILFAKFLVTFKNPLQQKRGMSFYYDVVDWVGGYPYEYASKEEITEYVFAKGFELIKFRKPITPTGCNEFVFKRKVKK